MSVLSRARLGWAAQQLACAGVQQRYYHVECAAGNFANCMCKDKLTAQPAAMRGQLACISLVHKKLLL
jgi:hypothetical protein